MVEEMIESSLEGGPEGTGAKVSHQREFSENYKVWNLQIKTCKQKVEFLLPQLACCVLILKYVLTFGELLICFKFKPINF